MLLNNAATYKAKEIWSKCNRYDKWCEGRNENVLNWLLDIKEKVSKDEFENDIMILWAL